MSAFDLILILITLISICVAVWAFRRALDLSARLTDIAAAASQAEVRHTAETATATAKAEALAQENARLASRIEWDEREQQQLRADLLDAECQNASLHTTVERMKAERQNEQELIQEKFANLATDILRRNSDDFKAASIERLGELLNPLRTNLDEFRRSVREAYDNEARQRFSLEEAVKTLANANNTISQETRDLTNALRGNNQVQGEWGEMVLESILEKSGLVRDSEYVVQATVDADGNPLRGEEGKPLRPDVVVKYPDGRCVVIDSKVSLTAYVDYVNAPDASARDRAGERHIKAVKAQVDQLAKKKYHSFIGEDQLDFVMMFIPNEPAYMTAMRLDAQLWQYAYDRNVLIVSPTHLVSGLRLISQLWSRDKVTKNAIRIADEAGKMYDKFADFVADMNKIEKAIASTQKAHQDAMRKLQDGTGNLLKRAQDLRELGIRASKQLAKADADSRQER